MELYVVQAEHYSLVHDAHGYFRNTKTADLLGYIPGNFILVHTGGLDNLGLGCAAVFKYPSVGQFKYIPEIFVVRDRLPHIVIPKHRLIRLSGDFYRPYSAAPGGLRGYVNPVVYRKCRIGLSLPCSIAKENIIGGKRNSIWFQYPETFAEIMHLVPFVTPLLTRINFSAGENRNVAHNRHIVLFVNGNTAQTVPFKFGIVFPGPLEASACVKRLSRSCQKAVFRSLKNRLVLALAFRNRNNFNGDTVEDLRPVAQPPIYIYILIHC